MYVGGEYMRSASIFVLKSIFMSMNVSMVVNVLEENFCRTIKQIFEAQHRLKEKNWEYKLQVWGEYTYY